MKLLKWLTTAALVAGLGTTALAQTDQGKLIGHVRDQSTAFVAGATVTVKNERTGESRTASSNNQGLFFVGGLKPSSYTIRLEKAGFTPSNTPT